MGTNQSRVMPAASPTLAPEGSLESSQGGCMDDAKNFVLGIFQTVKERFGNPLISAYALAWAVWNFRLLMVVMGDGDGGWRAKINYIDTQLMPRWQDWAVHGGFIPLAIALAWIYALPPILRRVAAHHERAANKTRSAIYQVTETRTLSAEDALEMRVVMLKKHAEWIAEKATTMQSLETYERATEALTAELESARAAVTNLKADIEALKRPPPREKFDFAGKETLEKAHALGLQLFRGTQTVEPLVLFDGNELQWPWSPSDEQRFELPSDATFRGSMSEETLYAMFCLAGSTPAGSLKSRHQWARELKDYGCSRPEEIVQSLYSHSFLSGSSNEPELTVNGRNFVNWLIALGFLRASQYKPDGSVDLVFGEKR